MARAGPRKTARYGEQFKATAIHPHGRERRAQELAPPPSARANDHPVAVARPVLVRTQPQPEQSMDRKTIVMVATLGFAGASLAQQGVFQTKSLTPETALSAAKAAMEFCRKQGYQVAVAVVDRAGLAQVVLRDRFAGAHTLDVASTKLGQPPASVPRLLRSPPKRKRESR